MSAPAICTLSDRLEAALEDGRIDLTPAELKLLVMILCPETEGGEQGKWLEDLRAMLAKHRDRKQRGRPATKPAASPTA